MNTNGDIPWRVVPPSHDRISAALTWRRSWSKRWRSVLRAAFSSPPGHGARLQARSARRGDPACY
jgi:hypothetical protein